MRAIIVAIAFAGAGTCASACPATFRVEPDRTTTHFAVAAFGVAVQRGRFERTWGSIVLDPVGTAGSVDFVVDATSVRTGWGLRDAFLRGEAMFDAERFPVIRFRSTRLAYAAAELVGVDGEVTMRGVTQPVHLAVTGLRCVHARAYRREECGAQVTTTLSRAAFGMNYAYPFVGDRIDLDFAITASRVRDGGDGELP